MAILNNQIVSPWDRVFPTLSYGLDSTNRSFPAVYCMVAKEHL